eukprot:TRINITY_DN58116_c0_g1_i1.p1 TRINITY_DN58116_c0_g1~~TRINITY_DN58116_c0_g1_i1.p1  ORF type:complete len:177 (+),score=93.74 TRINITY_DN58116_c0_g1_i1:445-975(+)
MSSVRMTLIVRQVVRQLLGDEINYEKIDKLTTSKRLRFQETDVKAMIAALHFILRSATKYAVEENVLEMELMQLGLPKDIVRSIVRCFVANRADLDAHLRKTSFQLPRVTSTEWRVDYLLGSSARPKTSQANVRMKINTSDGASLPFELSADKFRVLHHELKQARSVMNALADTNQ